MSAWRPKDWKNPYTQESTNPWVTRDFAVWSRIHEQGANNMLQAICEEIEKVEGSEERESPPYYRGFADAVDKILALLKE